MKRPLHKHPVFWTVALVVVLAVNVVQIFAGMVWVERRSVALAPAPRSEERPILQMGRASINQNDTYIPKPGEWQIPQYHPSVFNTAPTQVVILPTKFGRQGDGRASWAVNRGDRAIGVGMPPRNILQTAYEWQSYSRMVVTDPLPNDQYDYLANLPSGSFEALREEAKQKIGLVAERQMRSMDVLLLRLVHTNAAGLKAVTQNSPPTSNERDKIYFSFATMSTLTSFLEAMLTTPIIDETGLTGHYQMTLPQMRRTGPVTSEWIEQNRSVILEVLGLDLVKTNQPVEVLVVKKVIP